MIAIVGGGLAAAKLVEGYREAGGDDEITIWAKDPRGPYHRPPLSKRLLRGEAEPPDALVHPLEWYDEQKVELRLGETLDSLDDVRADTIVIATGARPRELPGTSTFRTLDDSLALFADVLMRPKLDDKDIERVRGKWLAQFVVPASAAAE